MPPSKKRSVAAPRADDAAAFTCRYTSRATPLPHTWERCVGSGHAPLCLRADWQAQMAKARRDIGFERVRFHGILSEGMGTLVEELGQLVYSFHNADLVLDYLVSIGVRPIVELSFMPRALASGDATVMSYAANVTPPKDLGAWKELIGKLVAHWRDRYGAEETDRWLFEVWNEPNLRAFWTGGREAYFELYRATAAAVKGVSPSLRVGGPATAKSEWIPEFLRWCDDASVPVDFVSTHIYPTDALGEAGTDTTQELAESGREFLLENARRSREQAGGLPLYYTEWNVTSNPRDELHDQPFAAAYVTKAVLDVAGVVDGYSYWALSDVFEENYFPSKPFHGGFGLLTLHGVPKPTYRALELLHRVGFDRITVSGSHSTVQAWAIRALDRVTIVFVNCALPHAEIHPERVRFRLEDAPPRARARVERVDEDHGNARRTWIAWGSPDDIDARQVAELVSASAVSSDGIPLRYDGDCLEFEITLPVNGVAHVTIEFEPGAPVRRAEAEDGDDAARMLRGIQADAFAYFPLETDPDTGLVRDRSKVGAPASIAATGLGLAAFAVAAERGWVDRGSAVARVLSALRALSAARQGGGDRDAGHRGFFFHFLVPETCRRAGTSEVSTIDTAILVAGALAAAQYFDRDTLAERELRALADAIYRRVDWTWALAGGRSVSNGWMPHTGFLSARWEGYSEALLLYVLGLGSPTFPLPEDAYAAWCEAFTWKEAYGETYLYAGPLFIHQSPHTWLDLRGVRDAAMRAKGLDYFENSRRATIVQQRYAIDNPRRFEAYGEHMWGITASCGPGPEKRVIDGVEREFLGYAARGVPFGPDDGTLAPWAVVASLPFAPEIVLPTIRHLNALGLREQNAESFEATFNPTFRDDDGATGWVSPHSYGLNQGPIVLMIENYLTGLPWRLMRGCPYVRAGLERAGFTGGWLDGPRPAPP